MKAKLLLDQPMVNLHAGDIVEVEKNTYTDSREYVPYVVVGCHNNSRPDGRYFLCRWDVELLEEENGEETDSNS